MTLNYNAHEKQIEAAYRLVGDSADGDKWVIYDYEGNSNTLRVGEEGTGGLDEFAGSFSSGKLQFGVIAVRLSSDVIPKIVLIHWQGEGVPTLRLASTTQHAEEFRRFLKTVHIVLHARSEIDVEPDVIRKEVAKLPAANTTAHVESSYSLPEKIESVYKPTKPHVELNHSARDQFWNKMNDEEKKRVAEEKSAHQAQQKQYEADRQRTAAEIQSQAENYQPEKVTSVYKPIKPHVELKSSEREEFWNKMNEEEKKRVAEEKSAHQAQQKQYEADRQRTAAEIQSQAENYQPEKVTSVYKPIKPHVELKSSEREEFWNKMNEEEKKRIAEEKRENEAKQLKFDEERKRTANEIHEKMENGQFEKKEKPVITGGLVGSRKEIFASKDPLPLPKPIGSNGSSPTSTSAKKWPPVSTNHQNQEIRDVVNRQEAQNAAQEIPQEPTKVAYVPEPFVQKPISAPVPESQPTYDAYEVPPQEPEQPQSPPTFLPPAPKVTPTQLPPPPSQFSSQYDTLPEDSWGDEPEEKMPAHISSQYDLPPPSFEQQPEEPKQSYTSTTITPPKIDQYDFPPSVEESLKAMALWDYQAADDTEISFDPDDIITDIDQVDEGWWKGKSPNGQIGLFPANYVKLL
ncbi:unnamed protein product [Caenorhabditis angaria]|uniref:SH3 domain-containing protein n=1 Tax=Caenorhabditis angaria TaxID=860376 RepID=A0A9P1IH59_9PELO|nr:unnamed protein product [Caenorhabditis angaria]